MKKRKNATGWNEAEARRRRQREEKYKLDFAVLFAGEARQERGALALASGPMRLIHCEGFLHEHIG